MKILVCVVAFLSFSVSLAAQGTNRSSGQGYVFFAPGVGDIGPGNETTLQLGVGGEGFIYRGLGLGVEIGPVGLWPGRYEYSPTGLGSANLSYHFLRDRNVEPFVTAGYSMFFRHGISQGSNFGEGVNVWLNENMAMRFEVRHHESRLRYNTGFRIGVTFR